MKEVEFIGDVDETDGNITLHYCSGCGVERKYGVYVAYTDPVCTPSITVEENTALCGEENTENQYRFIDIECQY